MRHGESEANVAGIIMSNPERGCNGYGLTENGRLQVKKSASNCSDLKLTRIITSDFLRARETAEIVAKMYQLPAPVLDTGLRERWFGEYDGEADSHYRDVWSQDELAEQGNYKQVENVGSVLKRGLSVISRLENKFSNEVLLVVSHGDMLQILRTAFDGLSASKHRYLTHHQTAEIIKF